MKATFRNDDGTERTEKIIFERVTPLEFAAKLEVPRWLRLVATRWSPDCRDLDANSDVAQFGYSDTVRAPEAIFHVDEMEAAEYSSRLLVTACSKAAIERSLKHIVFGFIDPSDI